MYHFTALVTLLAVLVYFYSSILVSRARGKFGVKLPAISGNPDFERVFRAQMNTLEWLPIFLPALWLFAIYIGDAIAAGIGLDWVVGRVLYVLCYARAGNDRAPRMLRSALAMRCWSGVHTCTGGPRLCGAPSKRRCAASGARQSESLHQRAAGILRCRERL